LQEIGELQRMKTWFLIGFAEPLSSVDSQGRAVFAGDSNINIFFFIEISGSYGCP
jgi:hypothetical protein